MGMDMNVDMPVGTVSVTVLPMEEVAGAEGPAEPTETSLGLGVPEVDVCPLTNGDSVSARRASE